jgi:PhnB protein
MSISHWLNRRINEAGSFNASLTFPPVKTRSAIMSKANVKPIPDGMHSITPHLVCAGAADAIEFYKKAFNAFAEERLPGPDGKLMHAMVRIGDSALMLVDEMPEWGALGPTALKGSPVTIHLYVENVDATVAQAVAAGAKITMPVEDTFWGDRYGQLQDPFGHKWSVATHTRDMSPEEIHAAMGEAMAKMSEPCAAATEK